MPVEVSPSPHGLPTSAHLAAGNGGEYRKSYHGFASDTAYVIDSPQSLTVVAMQIDTWNRAEMKLTGGKFVPGPQPRQSGAKPRHGEEMLYSGLLECPITTRVTKHIDDASAPFGAKSGSHQYYDPNPPPSNCEYEPCGGPPNMTVGARNMTIPWGNDCYPEPRESVLSARNPTCDLAVYAGGLRTCKHMWSLLDADQEIPWRDQPLRYYQKYRFYYQPYSPRVHLVSEPRVSWGIGAGDRSHSEYDVPQCAEGTPADKCTHVVWGVVTPAGKDLHLAAVHMHVSAGPPPAANTTRRSARPAALSRPRPVPCHPSLSRWRTTCISEAAPSSRPRSATLRRASPWNCGATARESCSVDRRRSTAAPATGRWATGSTSRGTSSRRRVCGGRSPRSSRCPW